MTNKLSDTFPHLLQQNSHTTQMEAALELEDDVFFKDLSKQISLLIMDDDDDEGSLSHCPSLNLQVYISL